MQSLGFLYALLALVCWGVGDFSIQRATRAVGTMSALFFIGLIGSIGIFPFVREEIMPSFSEPQMFHLLLLTSAVACVAGIANLEGLRRGKISVIEPVTSMDLPIAVILSVMVWGERITGMQFLLIADVFLGVLLAVTVHHSHWRYHQRSLEPGVLFAVLGTIGTGFMIFLVGISSNTSSPLLTIWYVHSIVAVVCFLWLLLRGSVGKIIRDFREHSFLVLSQSILDTAAWIAYAYSTTLMPISIASTVSEAYVVVAVALGFLRNRERVGLHQLIGIVIVAIGVLVLAAVTE